MDSIYRGPFLSNEIVIEITLGGSLFSSIRLHFPLLLLVLILSSIQLFSDELSHIMSFQRAEILDGEWWRLISSQFIHLGWGHLLLNLAALITLWILFIQRLTAITWLGVVLLCLIGTTAGLLVLNPEVVWYVGLSGALHGLFVVGAYTEWRQGNHRIASALLLLLTIKLSCEQFQLALPLSASTLIGAPVIVNAHLYGALSGALSAGLILAQQIPLRVDRS
jgi:rhomboid family GlyGly-CTERM serine protease